MNVSFLIDEYDIDDSFWLKMSDFSSKWTKNEWFFIKNERKMSDFWLNFFVKNEWFLTQNEWKMSDFWLKMSDFSSKMNEKWVIFDSKWVILIDECDIDEWFW
jgi:hypothetical protein